MRRTDEARLHHDRNSMLARFCVFRIRAFVYGMLLVSFDFTVRNVGVFRRLGICRGSFGWSVDLPSNSFSALCLLGSH